ncbi:MICAL-like protein 2a [Halichoeres trimaculatus]|uniref:MICAL-like protein 2a n=1 Tax=Halichoeres trimaculatus TaxID=147232 RepID=UPI003D9F03F8
MAAIKALEQWCKNHCEGYRDVTITNMTTSFRNGLAFCALIHQYRPDLIDYDSLRKEDVLENNRLAFQVAEEKLGIPALLDAEDMVALRIPDRLSILTYVSQYYNYFNGRNPMGGVKRPAEGSKEEPSERKKNLPVVAKTFVSKTAAEKRSPSSFKAQTSPAQKPIPAENSNKNGTLNSKCAACKSHIHLVQRHFVEGKLYHRSCFRCCDCSGTLHAGAYKPGKAPDTFICTAHHNGSSSSDTGIKNSSSGRCNSAIQTQPASRPLSVLTAPLQFTVKPLTPSQPSPSWTASAQKTQSARQRFFQTGPQPGPEASAGNRKPTESCSVSGRPNVPVSSEEKKIPAKTIMGKTLAEENCNNNNKRLFSIRPAERRLGQEPAISDSPTHRNANFSQGPAGRPTGRPTGRPSSSQTNNPEFPRLKAVNKDDTRPTAVHTAAADPIQESHPEPEPVNVQPASQDTETEVCDPGFTLQTSSIVSTRTTQPPSAPAVDPAPFDPSQFGGAAPQKPQPGLKSPSVSGFEKHSSVKSPPRRPAEDSTSSSTPAPADHGNPSRAKKGKYLSPTNASRTEMRSPSVKPYHVPAAQIERQLDDIEMNLAQLEKEGVELEKRLRSCEEEGDGDVLMDPLMVDWFNLIQRKQMFIRKESELVYTARTQELERQQPGVEGELRRLLEKPDHLKSREEQQQEEKLMLRLVEIVDGRNAIVDNLDEDRRREEEEDQQLSEMMKNLGVKRGKTKRKSSVSKLFRRRSKRQVE